MSSTDPFDIGQDVFRVIVSNLDPQSLARSLLVSKNWLLACSSPSLWRAHCEVHAPHLLLHLLLHLYILRSVTSIVAYFDLTRPLTPLESLLRSPR